MVKNRLFRVLAVLLLFLWGAFLLLAFIGGSFWEWLPVATAALVAAFLFVGAVYWALNPKT
jgi:ABC-type microcin C transport system permease subunit YejB